MLDRITIIIIYTYELNFLCTSGGCWFELESHPSSLFSMKTEKRALRFISLPCLCSLKFTCIHSIWSVMSSVVYNYYLITPASSKILSLSLPCLSGLIRHFALFNLCDLNPTSWATSVVQFVEQLP